MADRRMIHRKVIESDSFYSLPEGAQAMYTHLSINADDDGFVNCAGSIASRIKNGKAMLKKLVDERFVLRFGEVYVLKHWRIGNSLKNDRSKPLTYPSIAAALWLKPNRSYTDHPVDGCQTLLELKTGIQNGIRLESEMESQQNRTEKNRTEKNRTDAAEECFGQLWDDYPELRRGVRGTAFEAFKVQILTEEDFATAVQTLAAWKQSEQWEKDGGQYVPYLCNWLERGIWRSMPPDANRKDRSLDADELEAIRRMMEE